VAHLRRLFGLGRIRLLLAAIFTLNLAFSGLQTNFPLFSQARFQWDAGRNGIFYAFVGCLAVFVQGRCWAGSSRAWVKSAWQPPAWR